MRHDIGLCSAPCVGMISKDAYAKNVRHAALLLGRDTRYRDRLAANIRLKMLASSKILDFERANEYKLNIASIEFIASCQAVELTNKVDIDVISRSVSRDSVVYSIIRYINGVLLEKLCFEFHPSMENDSYAALRIIYKNTKLPTQVVIETPAVNDDAAAFFAQQNVEVLAPEQAMQFAIIAHKNLTAVNSDKSSVEDAGVNALCSLLKIDTPSRIECIDISHMAGKSAYGSLIVWDEGSLNKRLYRSYKLSDSYDGNDYAAISQVVKRRYNDNPLPDILVIDGGKAHLDYLVNEINQNATLSAKMHACELIGIVKAEGRNPTKDRLFIYSSSSFTTFNEHTNVLRFIQTLRDEAHRFAGKMMHRDKALLQQRSLLTAIPGIGGKKQRSLMEFFGNSALIATATLAQLIAAPGIGQQTALVIYRHFHPNELSK
jgi:excinuclease ABC subunit C